MMTNSIKTPQVGVGVLVFKNKQVLLGQRINAHGGNTWCPPGGHLDFAESWEECARRETFEEVGIEISEPKLLSVSNDLFLDDDKHYVTILMGAKYAKGQVTRKEPEKCLSWQWFNPAVLPAPLFLSIEKFFKQTSSTRLLNNVNYLS